MTLSDMIYKKVMNIKHLLTLNFKLYSVLLAVKADFHFLIKKYKKIVWNNEGYMLISFFEKLNPVLKWHSYDSWNAIL